MKIEHIGSASFPLRLLCWLAALAFVLGLFVALDLRGLYGDLDADQAKEQVLRDELVEKQGKAASLAQLRDQQDEIKESIRELLKQLPDETEVPGLLQDISQQGLASGLEIEAFEPQGERDTEYYVELPINIQVSGDYEKFGTFVSGVAQLPRIVTIQDVKITRKKGSAADEYTKLQMTATAKTYRSLEQQ